MKRMYDTVRWRKARKMFLAAHPLCTFCESQGIDAAAKVVDHKVPHNEDPVLFWDEGNWQPLCSPCHSRLKQIEEQHGYSAAAGLDGTPLDPGHPWNTGRVGGSNLTEPPPD